MKHLIQSHCHRAATHLATFKPSHSLFQTIRKAKRNYPKRHMSPLHDILHISRIDSNNMETIDPHPRHLCWKPPFNIQIAQSKEEACEADRDNKADIRIYSDSSGRDGRIGVAAIMKFGFRVLRKARFYLGRSNKLTVFEGKCIGQLLGLKLLQSSGFDLNGREVSLGIDSQVAIIRHNARSNAPAAYIINEIHRTVYDLTKAFPRLKITFRWTPGHAGLAGNEEMHVKAKKAAAGAHHNVNSNFSILRRPLPISRSAHRQTLRNEITAKYQREFWLSDKYQRFIRVDPSMPSNRYRKLIAELPRRFVSILTQLQTNHVPLQAYLHKFKLADSPL